MDHARIVVNPETDAVTDSGAGAVKVLNDREFAAEVRRDLASTFDTHVLPILRRARSRGVDVQFNIGPDWQGQPVVQNIATVKRLD